MRAQFLIFVTLFLLLPSCVSSTRVVDKPACAASTTLGTSRSNRPIDAVTVGRGGTRVYFIGSIHGDEGEGLAALGDVRRALSNTTCGTTVRLVHDMNPDGSLARTRANAAGVDLNRNWPASNFRAARSTGPAPLSEPEVAAIHADIIRFDPHLIVVLHSSRSGPFVNYDGPGSAQSLANRFVAAARGTGDARWRTVPDMGYPTPGSMGTYFGKDRGVPILTVELCRGENDAKAPRSLVAGLTAVLADRSVALMPLSGAKPARKVASESRPARVTAFEQAR